jgi:hypothetical protein
MESMEDRDDEAVRSPTLPTVLGNRQRAAITTFPPHHAYGHFYFAEIRTFELCSNNADHLLELLLKD